MISKQLQNARIYTDEHINNISPKERPAFHLTGDTGWINDPNGFSFYQGEYHLFYQSHPYSNEWGPMHWGHAKSDDLLIWKRLPIAMAPDETYDNFGCFSGSALELSNHRHVLMYTGVHTDSNNTMTQTQCLSFGDGIQYEKYSGNPIILPDTLPKGSSSVDFRDPKLWQEKDGTFYAVMASVAEDGNGQIVLYKSNDLYSWKFCSILEKSSKKMGGVWECPDFFQQDGKYALLVSPMSLLPDNKGFHVGHGTLAMIGDYNEDTYSFQKESYQPIDYGIDFYAPQSILAPDGRRLIVAWMQAWPNSKFAPPNVKYFGQLTIPRELHIRNNRLIQAPIREIENYRTEKISYDNLVLQDQEISIDKISGRVLDMTVTLHDMRELSSFTIKIAQNEEYHTSVSYSPQTKMFCIDRSFSGYPFDIVHKREFPIISESKELKIRMLLDRFSVELFINEGEQTASMTIFTPQEADNISFSAKGNVLIDVEKYRLNF